MTNRIIYWFRNDLRLNDNEAFWKAVNDSDEIIPVYVFDLRRFRFRNLGFRKVGLNRALYILDAVSKLQNQMRERGGELLIRWGEPEKIIAGLAQDHNVSEVRASKEITLEETNIEASLSKKLKGINVDISLSWMSTLIHPHDLPFFISRLPDQYERFAEQVRPMPIRSVVPEKGAISFLSGETGFVLPGLRELGFEDSEINQETKFRNDYRNREEIRSQFSSKIGGAEEWVKQVSAGFISPRDAYHKTFGSPLGEAVYSQLLWRDYLLFVALKYGTRLFKPSGLVHQIDRVWKYDREAFEKWREGRTTDLAVNARMEELRALGAMSFEPMQTVARHLIDEMGVNWTWGASWVESQLEEYEVALHWGNWNYFAGVGPGMPGMSGEKELQPLNI